MGYFLGFMAGLGILQIGLCDVTDPCPFWTEGLHADGKCYKMFGTDYNYQAAQSLCEQQGPGTHLPEIFTEQQDATLKLIIQALGEIYVWLGVKYNSQISNFEWVQTGKILGNKSSFWAHGEPNNGTRDEECVILEPKGFTDITCTRTGDKFAVVCQRDAGLITNPCYFWEGATYVNGKCFKTFNRLSTWSDALKFCRQETPSGTLAELFTDHEWRVLSDMLQKSRSNEVWLGYSDLLTARTFLWSSSNSSSPAPISTWWAPGNPGRGNSSKHCVTLNSDSPVGTMSTVDCAKRKNVTCQRAADNPCELLMSAKAEYFQGRCYLFVSDKVNWTKAQNSCRQSSAYLTEPTTKELQDYVFDLARRNTGEPVWIGGVGNQGDLRWASTREIIRNVPGLLVNGCGLQVLGQTKSRKCFAGSSQSSFICEKDIGDPCETYLPGAIYSGGQCFKYFNDSQSWQDAQKSCAQRGAILAEPRTSELKDAVNAYLQSRPASTAWLGGRLVKTDTLQWYTDGQSLDYSLLTDAPPSHHDEGYLAVTNGHHWSVEDKHAVYPFICQRGVEIGKDAHRSIVALFPNLQNAVDLKGYVQISGNALSYRVDLEIRVFIDGLQSETTVTSLQPKTVFLYSFEPQQLMTLEGLHASYVEVLSSSPVTAVLYIVSSHTLAASTLLLPSDLFKGSDIGSSYLLVSACTSSCAGNVVTATTLDGPSEVSVLFPKTSSASRQLTVGNISYSQFTTMTTTFPSRHGTVYFNNDIDFDGAFLSSKSKIAVFIGGSGTPTMKGPADVTLDQVLPVQFIDRHYVTFPSRQAGLTDFVKVVAVESNTIVQVNEPPREGHTGTFHLHKSGDAVEIQLLNDGFFNLSGNVAFYAFRFSKNVHGNPMCLTSLYPDGLWKHQYSFQASPELTGHNFSVVVIVPHQSTFDINLGGSDNANPCRDIQGTELAGCIYTLPWSNITFYDLHLREFNDRFGAYVIVSSATSLLCHSLGVRDNPQPTYSFNSDKYRRFFSDPPECNASTTTTIYAPTTETLKVNSLYDSTPADTSKATTSTDPTASSLSSTSATRITDFSSSLSSTSATRITDFSSSLSSTSATRITDFSSSLSSTSATRITDFSSSLSSTSATRITDFSSNYDKFLVNTKATSAHRRRKSSAPDDRIIPVIIGSTGIICMVVMFGTIVIGDMIRLCKFINHRLRRGKRQSVGYAE